MAAHALATISTDDFGRCSPDTSEKGEEDVEEETRRKLEGEGRAHAYIYHVYTTMSACAALIHRRG